MAKSKNLTVSTNKTVKVIRGHSRKHAVPPNLGRLIDLLNLLPAPLPHAINIWDKVMVAREAPSTLLLVIDELPQKVREFVLPQKERKDIEQDPLHKDWRTSFQWFRTSAKYDHLVEGKKLLFEIADLMSRVAPDNKPLYKQPIENLKPILNLPVLSARLTVNDKGKPCLQPTLLLQCIEEIDDVRRIRRCPICQKLYWAARIDQPTCSKRCNNVRRSRIQRGTYEKKQAS